MASGEPWTMCTSTPPIRSRRCRGSAAIHAAKGRLVCASV